jgi:hypothetical protein
MDVIKTKPMRISGQPSSAHIVMDQKQLENVGYLIHFGSKITNDARCAHEVKSRIVMTPSSVQQEKLFSPTIWT